MKKSELSYKKLIITFLKTGLAFGGGLGVMSSLQEEFVNKLKLLERHEFLSIWGIARIVPGGTIGALAVALGYRFKKMTGAIIAAVGITLPGLSIALVLAALYEPLKNTPFFDFMNEAVIPAALGLIVLAIFNLAKDIFHSKLLILFAINAFIFSFLGINTTAILIGQGIVAAFILIIRKRGKNGTS